MSRVIVTGGAGRLGRSVVAVLDEQGHDVVSVDKLISSEVTVRQIEHELLDEEATRQLFAEIAPEAVVHLASIPAPDMLPPEETYSINIALTCIVLEATVASGATSLLVASSPTVIGYGNPDGWKPEYLPLDEEHPRQPWNRYADSKVAMEDRVAKGVVDYGDSVSFGVFRPCYVIAPEEWEGAITQQGHTVTQRLEDPALSSVALFNYVDARDAGEFVDAWLNQCSEIPNGSVFFVGAGDALALGPMSDLLPHHVPSVNGLADELTGTTAVFSIARARELLGWVPSRSWRTELRSLPERVPSA